MKNILFAMTGFVYLFGLVTGVQGAEYECVYHMNNNARCAGGEKITHTCRFPDSLNEIRTQEEKSRKFTFPEFCSKTCAEQSGIPEECRNGSIRKVVDAGIQDKTLAVIGQSDTYDNGFQVSLSGFFKYIKSIPVIIYGKIRNVLNPGINENCQDPAQEGGCIPIPTATAGVRG